MSCAKKRRIASPDWSNLKLNLVESVLKKLSYADIFGLKSVCSSWRSIAKAYISSSYSQKLPLLVVFPSHGKEDEDNGGIFFILAEEKEEEDCCIGSSHGWLIVTDKKTNLFMFNLFIPVGINLPSLSTFPGFDTNGLHGDRWIIKSILSCDPISGGQYGVVAIYGLCGVSSQLAFSMCGDTKWTKLEGSHKCYSDIICYKDHLYALSHNCALEVWEFKGPTPVKKMVAEFSFPDKLVEFEKPLRDLYSSQLYLIESLGEILLIVRFIGNLVREDGVVVHEADLLDDEEYSHMNCRYGTKKFYVYKLDLEEKKWVKLESLGDRMLFLGLNQSISLSAQDFQEYKRNSIYFTDDFWDGMNVLDNYAGHDMGVFELDNGNISHLYPPDMERIQPAFWVVPNPGRKS